MAQPSGDGPARLGLWDAVSIIVGIIIGSSIYKSPPTIFAGAGPVGGLAVWVLVGLISVAGALCYAELARAYPTSGGDYTYLTRAFGRPFGFFFAWSELAVIRTGGSIAIMGYLFAAYADALLASLTGTKNHAVVQLAATLGVTPGTLLAAASVVALTAVNAFGVRPGQATQNVLTVAKVAGMLAVIAAGFYLAVAGPPTEPAEPFRPEAFHTLPLALVFVFYAYGGWHEAAYVAGEMRRPADIVRALVYGVALVTGVYLAVNAAFLAGLGYDRVCSSKAVASDLMNRAAGETGSRFISVLVMVSALGAINGLLFTGVRLYRTFGQDHRLFGPLGRETRAGVGLNALLAQAAFSLFTLALIETAPRWRSALAGWVASVGVPVNLKFETTAPGFDTLVECTSPVFWTFASAVGVAFFVLRFRDGDAPRPFRVPLYPVAPLVFLGSSLFMLYKSVAYSMQQRPAEAIIVAGLMLLGIPLYLLSGPGAGPEDRGVTP